MEPEIVYGLAGLAIFVFFFIAIGFSVTLEGMAKRLEGIRVELHTLNRTCDSLESAQSQPRTLDPRLIEMLEALMRAQGFKQVDPMDHGITVTMPPTMVNYRPQSVWIFDPPSPSRPSP